MALTPKQLAILRRTPPAGRNRLAKAIELADVTQVQVADAVGVQQPKVSAIALGRYGESGPPVETARRFADYFGCTIEDLFPARDRQAVAS